MSGVSGTGPKQGRIRGQSNVIGVVLLLGLVVTGAAVVIYTGSLAITQQQETVSFSVAEESMEQLAADISTVSNGRSTTRVDTSGLRDGKTRINESAGRVNITIRNLTTGNTDNVETQLGEIRYERGERALVYQSGSVFEQTGDGTAVVSPAPVGYRTEGDTGSVTFPLVTVRGNDVDDSVTLERTGVRTLMADLDGVPESGAGPDPTDSTSPLPPGSQLTINISSDYYREWGRILESRIDAANAWITYDHAAETVTMTIRVPYATESISPVFLSFGSAVGSESAETDSYDSDSGDYNRSNGDFWVKGTFNPSNSLTIGGDFRAEDGAETITNTVTVYGTTAIGDNPDGNLSFEGGNSLFDDTFSVEDRLKIKQGSTVVFDDDLIVDNDTSIEKGDATVGGDVYIHGNATLGKFVDIDGDLIVDGNLTFVGQAKINGTVHASGDIEGEDQAIIKDGEPSEDVPDDEMPELRKPLSSEVQRLPAADDEIDLYEGLLSRENDNGQAEHITTRSLDSCPCTIPAGRYALDAIDEPGDVTFDTSGGDITLYVDENIDLNSGDDLQVTGPYEVRIYVSNTDGGGEAAVNIGGNAEVTVEDDAAPQLWLYTRSTDTVKIQKNSVFQGVLYGAGGRSVDGATYTDGTRIVIANNVDIYGAMIGDIRDVGNNVALHYDEAIGNEEVFGRGFDGARITYVHATARNVTVDR